MNNFCHIRRIIGCFQIFTLQPLCFVPSLFHDPNQAKPILFSISIFIQCVLISKYQKRPIFVL